MAEINYEEELAKLRQDIEEFTSRSTEVEAKAASFHQEEQNVLKLLESIRAKRMELQHEAQEIRYTLQRKKRDKERYEAYMAEQAEKNRRLKEIEELTSQLDELMASICGEKEFYAKMRGFQKEDLRYMLAAYKRGLKGVLNANDMGLGKTFEAIAFDYLYSQLFEQEHHRKPHVLWLTKKTLVKASTHECLHWNPERTIVPMTDLDSNMRNWMVQLARQNNALLITNYEAINGTNSLLDEQWDLVIMDEVHKLKSGERGVTWRNAKKIVDKCQFYLPMSGSPIQNTPDEMWAYLHLLAPAKFPSANQFRRVFGTWGSMRLLKINEDTLIKAMSGQVIRRRRDEVEIQLPPITRIVHSLELEGRQATLYNQMRDEFFVWLDDHGEKALTATAILAQLTRLRQIALYPDPDTFGQISGAVKIDEAMDIISGTVDEHTQIVVFSAQFNAPLKEIERRCKEFYDFSTALITGETSKDAESIVSNFQQGKIQVLLVNAKAGGEGLNLQRSERWPGGASTVIFLDLWYNPKFNEQAEARVYRQGQTHPVTVHILQAENTVDQFILDKLDTKTAMIAGLMESDSLRKGSDWKQYLTDLL